MSAGVNWLNAIPSKGAGTTLRQKFFDSCLHATVESYMACYHAPHALATH